MKKTLFALLGYALGQTSEIDTAILNDEALVKIYNLSKKHDLAHMIGYGLKKAGIQLDGELKKPLDDAVNMALFRYIKTNYDFEAMCAALEKGEVRFMPLKGSVIRKHYKEPWLRTSCDIDVLIHPDDLEKAKAVFSDELKYRYESEWNYDISFFTPDGTHIELHHTITSIVGDIDNVLLTVWEHASPAEGCKYRYEMSDAMYYFYHIAHMAQHFGTGGCGIRPFLDLWILNHIIEFDKEKRDALLERGGLVNFSRAAEELSEVWIGGASYTPTAEALERYTLSGGTYGTMENKVIAHQSAKGGRVRFLMSRLFLPYRELKIRYPILEKRKWLFPFCQVARWFRIFKKEKRKKSIVEFKISSEVAKSGDAESAELFRSLGL